MSEIEKYLNRSREDEQRAEDIAHQIGVELMRAREEIAIHGIRGLLLINGGGAAALLAFLQAIWKQEPALAVYVVTAIAWLGGGVAIAGLSFFLRINSSVATQMFGDSDQRTKWFSRVSVGSWYLSLLAFVIGLSWVVIGAWRLLPK